MKKGATIPGRSLRHARVVVRWVLGAIFLGAGALKIVHPLDFYSNLLAYDVGFPDCLVRFAAVVVPWLEVVCGGLLLVDYWTETVGFLATGLCLIFILMLSQAVVRGLDLKCGCFGSLTAGWFELPQVALVRACVLFVAAVWLLLDVTNRRSSVAVLPPNRE
jgi:uncharacterized membrane protein YphA (DoxX/SURF4 family)